jgi:hypothetical protein
VIECGHEDSQPSDQRSAKPKLGILTQHLDRHPSPVVPRDLDARQDPGEEQIDEVKGEHLADCFKGRIS